ncbi:TetR/AcrR family transcriptional regulator [Neobacillus sp. LXY-1]|uniref:TetR/AcrR family transcriptional regulator n=1 Tax=Neobacillus sp. LXY-1 TaxID=3379133 RepID=UPI003EE076FC
MEQNYSRPIGRPKANETEVPTSDLILQVATKLFLEFGYQKVSIDEVAKEAGMTKATVYYYYNSKAELYKEAMVALMGRVQQIILKKMEENKSLYERLMDITIAHLKATTSVDLEGFMRETKTSLTEEQVLEMKLAEEKMFASIEQGFKKAIDTGEIPNINTKFAAHAYIALIKVGNYKNSYGMPIFQSIQETAESLLLVFWRGFFGEPIPSTL